eukprot:COSAG06_NODE_5166_length_3667_cov_2.046525_2_plen_45_part_00
MPSRGILHRCAPSLAVKQHNSMKATSDIKSRTLLNKVQYSCQRG